MAGASRGHRGRWRRLRRGLTFRGRGLLVGSVLALSLGEALGERDLVRVAVLLAVLPLLAVVVAGRARYRIRLTRTVTPVRVQAGREARVLLRLENLGRLPTGTLLMEDTLPTVLGRGPHFVLRRVESAGVREASYAVRTDVRGRSQIGPLTVRLTDPFGCAELSRAFSSVAELLVTPVVWPLPPVRLGGDWIGGGEGRTTRLSVSGEADASIREYREGDDLRRVHWRTSARTGELMVRRDEAPRQQRAALLLDTRRAAHRGDGPASSFEYAVSAAASIAVWLARQGFGLHLVEADGTAVAGSSPAAAEPLLLDVLSVVEMQAARSVAPALPPMRAARGGLTVAVLGLLEDADLSELAALAPISTAAVAVLLDTPSWSTGEPTDRMRTAEHVLTAAGWRVLVVRAGERLEDRWSAIGSPTGRSFTTSPLARTASTVASVATVRRIL